jgi:hypothetical protein
VSRQEPVPSRERRANRNGGAAFWRFTEPGLGPDAFAGELDAAVEEWLSERVFGPGRYALSTRRRAYYVAKPLLPARFKVSLRGRLQSKTPAGGLQWPIEDRLVKMRERQAAEALASVGASEGTCVDLWPMGRSAAFVVTHDVETREGLERALDLADIDARHGFVSAFNLVAERYEVDPGVRRELVARGHEVGVHGLKHDGFLFWNRRVFDRRAARINRRLREWQAVGFRSPLTHRNPEWMQALDVEYDSSFFDTDPFEPMPGGTGSLWPYHCGRFVELPYTLPQDSTLFNFMKETGPRIWLEKLEYVIGRHGMALVNVRPDYVFASRSLAAYEQLLSAAQARDCWNALPRDVARWWGARASGAPGGSPLAAAWRAGLSTVRVMTESGRAGQSAIEIRPVRT